ncbi:MAG: zinc ABC transporter substrate-binding protein [Bacteroidetes bacterium]|nr:zinc ABC transporter substrate-binding protein [Bacteroidota bacterium]
MNRPFFWFCVPAIILFSCQSALNKEKEKVVTVSIPPQQYFVERIAGNHWKVFVLAGPGVGPETFDPSPQDLEKVSRSKLYFLTNYLEFEKQLSERLKRMSDGPLLVNTAEGIQVIEGDEHAGHSHGKGVDPHIWISPKEVEIQAKNICRALSDADPEFKTEYENNLKVFIRDLRQLDSSLKEAFENLGTRKFIIFHPALGYLARDYRLEQLSLEFDGKQPSTMQLKSLVDEARTAGISTIFLQAQYDIHNVETLSVELGGKVEIIDPLSSDWLNNMYLMTKKLREAMHGT